MEELREEARIEVDKKIILNLSKKGMGLQFMADVTGWTLEQIQSFLRSQNLQPAQ
jgi:transposase